MGRDRRGRDRSTPRSTSSSEPGAGRPAACRRSPRPHATTPSAREPLRAVQQSRWPLLAGPCRVIARIERRGASASSSRKYFQLPAIMKCASTARPVGGLERSLDQVGGTRAVSVRVVARTGKNLHWRRQNGCRAGTYDAIESIEGPASIRPMPINLWSLCINASTKRYPSNRFKR